MERCERNLQHEHICADDIERGGYGVGNGLDRGRVDVVVNGVDEMPACNVPAPNTSKDNKSTKPTTITL